MCSCLQPQEETGVSKKNCTLGRFILDHTPYNKRMSIIGGKLYVMGEELLEYCRFSPKCVSIGQHRMWQSTPKTYGKEHNLVEGPGPLRLLAVLMNT